MCGYAFICVACHKTNVFKDAVSFENVTGKNITGLLRRGPDHTAFASIELPSGKNAIATCGCILSQRGLRVVKQPLVLQSENKFHYYLFWNGEVFSSTDSSISDSYQSPDSNDAEVLLSHLMKNSPNGIIQVLRSLRGPMSFILYELKSGRLWFGRDRIGRRSLVGERTPSSVLENSLTFSLLSSVYLPPVCPEVKPASGWLDIPACGIFEGIMVEKENVCSISTVTLYPWTTAHAVLWNSYGFHIPNVMKPLLDQPDQISFAPSNVVETFLKLLTSAVQDRVLLASSVCKFCPLSQSEHALSQRCGHARFAILFSGGLDSTVLACLCHSYVPLDEPIDLINVAFEQEVQVTRPKCNPAENRKDVPCSNGYISVDEAPDRKTALASFAELTELLPNRRWQLVKVNVTVDELRDARHRHVNDLLQPGPCTVLDDSLGLAMWFGARGQGELHRASGLEPGAADSLAYTSPAKVVFVGSGIDEQLAGYSRHRVKFEKFGEDSLVEELNMEMLRISERNLGRDDRMISDHGREARLPYLDERVVDFLASLPIGLKADLRQPRGVGDKLLLREVARLLGLKSAAGLVKRAMQFGSRVAKAELASRKLAGPADKGDFRASGMDLYLECGKAKAGVYLTKVQDDLQRAVLPDLTKVR